MAKKKKVQVEILDPTGVTVVTHHFHYEAGYGNRLKLTIGDNQYMLTYTGKLMKTIKEEEPEPPPGKLVNGKYYPMWSQFVDQQNRWIGGTLEDSGDSFDRTLQIGKLTTEITGIELNPNGETGAFFQVVGKDFTCGFSVEYGGIRAGEEGWIIFGGYGGHTWRIKARVDAEDN